MACNFRIVQCENLDEGLRDKGLLFAQDWGRGSAAKKFFLITCYGSEEDVGVYVQQTGANLIKRKRMGRHMCHISTLAHVLTESDKHRYEVLQAEFPLKLFLDVEWPVVGHGDDTEASKKVNSLLQYLKEYGLNHDMFTDHIVLNASRCGKRSYHIIYPNAVFRKIDMDLKYFVHGFVLWLNEYKKAGEMTYLKNTKRGNKCRCIIDTAVYTKNRCFRLLGQSKASDTMRTKLVLHKFDPDVNCEDTLVQSTELLQCDHAHYIDRLLMNRAPADGFYPIYPSPDFGHTARKEGSVCIQMHKSVLPGIDKSTSEIVVSKKLGILLVKQDEDILNNLNADELKQADFTCLFLPVLCSLATVFTDEKLTQWMGCRFPPNRKICMRLKYARQKGSEDKLVKCEVALAFLKKKHKQVVDMRQDCILSEPCLQVIEPAKSEGWQFVKNGEELTNTLSSLCLPDKKSTFQRKRSFFISGKMGVGKTKGVLLFAKKRLAEDVYKHVTYFGPRTVLVKQVSEVVEDMPLGTHVRKRKAVTVHRYYTGMDDDVIYIHGVRCRPVKPDSNRFHAACINSAARTPTDPDVVIVDEAVVDVGNMFICSKQCSGTSGKGNYWNEKAIQHDRDMIQAVIDRIRKASVVIYIDAAFTKDIMHAFSMIWSTLTPFSIERYSGNTRKILQASVTRVKKTKKDVTFYTDNTFAQNCQVSQEVRIAVYNPCLQSGIFYNLEEFTHYKELKMDIINTIINGNTCIVYTSNSRTAAQLINMIKSIGTSPVPMMTLVTAEFVKQNKDVGKCINDMNTSVFVAASNVLSCGVSFEQEDMFDTAYAVFDFSLYTPPLSDMIQLCARVRSITSKTLRYTVISRGCKYHTDRDTKDVFKLRNEQLSANPVWLAFHKVNEAEYIDHVNMCRQRAYAAACVKNALKTAFTHINGPTTEHTVPKYKLNEQHDSSNLPTSVELSQYRRMCRNLPCKTTYTLYAGTKRPLTVTRNDLPQEAYSPAPSYELSNIVHKNGSKAYNSVEPIPVKKKVEESLSYVDDEEDSLFSDVESLGNTIFENSNDEFECRGDI